MPKRYYMGSLDIGRKRQYDMNKELLKTEDEAIEDARQFLEKNPQYTQRYIVKVVKVVKRQSFPIVVEDVD